MTHLPLRCRATGGCTTIAPHPRCHRRIDFLVLAPGRGMIAIEVKGGLVHVRHGRFGQTARSGERRRRKRIAPFHQAMLALAELWTKTGIAAGDIPVHIMAAFPHMSEQAYPWGRASHLLTIEDLEADRLRNRLQDVLPEISHGLAELERLAGLLAFPRRRARRAKSKKCPPKPIDRS